MHAEGAGGLRPVSADTTLGEYVAEFSYPVAGIGMLPVRLSRDEGGTVLAVDLITNSYGLGLHAGEALSQLVGAVHRHHAFLVKEGPDGLSARLAGQLNLLNSLPPGPSMQPGAPEKASPLPKGYAA